jgi:hypothetical protein
LSDALSFGGTVIGDALRFWPVIQRGTSPLIQSGVARKSAIVSDPSPNKYYELHVIVFKSLTNPLTVARWVTALADMIDSGENKVVKPKDAMVSTADGNFTLPEAYLVTPIQPPLARDTNPNKVLEIELVFVSARRPQ